MLDYQLPRIAQEDVTDTNGTFVVEPLERGFGYTYGNALRRVLLSSIEGAAVTSVKIEGVQHEFSSIKGVREDVTDIILNLKGLVAVLHGDSGEVEARILKDGPAVVTAADIDVSVRARDHEPRARDLPPRRRRAPRDDAHGRARSRLRRGHRQQGPRDDDRRDSGRLDLLARPPRRGRASIRLASVSAPTSTGSRSTSRPTARSTPRDAIQQAAELMIRQLAIFTDLDTSDLSALVGISQAGAAEPDVPQANGMENILIEELELGVRSYNCLKRVGIETIGDLVSNTEQELAAIPNFGKKSIEEVKETLGTHGLRLRGDD